MAAKAGAGASVSSGASYQARIGAYLLATSICDVESEITKDRKVLSLGFETTESIDDINIALASGATVYIQAKAKIDYSISKDGELRSVLEQFEKQHHTHATADDEYCLVTSGRSSRKIIYDMRAALEAFRLGPEDRFRHDQPKALVRIIDELLGILGDLQTESGRTPNGNAARVILRKTFVFAMDLDSGDAMEQGLLLLLQSRQFATSTALWGKIVADCVAHAKSRHTVNMPTAAANYERFRAKSGSISEQASSELLRMEFGDLKFSVGREVVLGRVPVSSEKLPPGLAIIEFYRFDDDCRERILFSDDTFILGDGTQVPLIRRAATYEGLLRLIDGNPALVGDEKITLMPINSEEDFETGLCAETHCERLKRAALANPHPLHCIHCGKPVSSNAASMVETGQGDDLIVGLSHEQCLAPADRVLGTARSQFFERHPELVNFDVNAWFRAAHGGQIAFANAELIRAAKRVIAWGGRRHRRPPGPFVVEMFLAGGGREFVTRRNSIQRFSKAEADEFVVRMNKKIQELRGSDPFCYTEQTKSFSTRSTLIEQLGGKERILVVESARARPYNERFAARYTRPGHWYAPLLYLRDISSGEILSILGSVALLTAPLSLANYLDNWRAAGIPIPNYETVSLLTDRDFDDFMLWLEDNEKNAIVDPMVRSDTSTKFVSGIQIESIETIENDHSAPNT